MTTELREANTWQSSLLGRLGAYRATHGFIASVQWLRNQGLSVPLAVLVAFGE
jgi:hypothetical protein